MGNRWRAWAWGLQDVKGAVKMTLLALADLCHDVDEQGRPNDACFPKISTLERMTGSSPRTLQRHLSELEALGYVLRFEQSRRGGSQSSNLYRLSKLPAGRQLSLFDAQAIDETLTDPVEAKEAAEMGGVTNWHKCPDKMTGQIGQNVAPYDNTLTTIRQEKGARPDPTIRPLVSLDDFLGKYDERGIRERGAIARAWERLSGPEQVRAVRSLGPYGAELRANPWRQPKLAQRYLAEKIFDDFQPVAVDTASERQPARPEDPRLAQLQEEIGAAAFASWFKDAELERGDRGAVLHVSRPFLADWINRNYAAALDRVFEGAWRVEVKEKRSERR